MPAQVKCPYCKTIFKALCGNVQSCRNRDCKATLYVDSNGNIRRSDPPKRK